jgi:hypothetical protein
MGKITKSGYVSDFEIMLPYNAKILTSGRKFVFNLKDPKNELDRFGNLKVKRKVNYDDIFSDQLWINVTDLVIGDVIKIANHSGFSNLTMLQRISDGTIWQCK